VALVLVTDEVVHHYY